MNEDYKTITDEEVKKWRTGTLSTYELSTLTDILTGEYKLEDARKDILGFRK